MRQKVGFIFLHTLLMCTLYSCKSDNTANTAFDDKIILIENNPQQYLARIDTIRPNSVNDEKEATDFLLYSLAHNYINRNYYPSKELLLTSIQTFQRRNLPQQQLEALFLLAKIYRKEQDLSSEVHTIENAVRIAKSEEDSEWLFYLYSYLGDMYIRQYKHSEIHKISDTRQPITGAKLFGNTSCLPIRLIAETSSNVSILFASFSVILLSLLVISARILEFVFSCMACLDSFVVLKIMLVPKIILFTSIKTINKRMVFPFFRCK